MVTPTHHSRQRADTRALDLRRPVAGLQAPDRACGRHRAATRLGRRDARSRRRRCRCSPCPARAGRPVTRGNVVTAIGVGLSAVLVVDRIRRYPMGTETTRLEENSRVAFSFVVVCCTTRSEKVSIPRLWATVANATLARCQHRPAAAFIIANTCVTYSVITGAQPRAGFEQMSWRVRFPATPLFELLLRTDSPRGRVCYRFRSSAGPACDDRNNDHLDKPAV